MGRLGGGGGGVDESGLELRETESFPVQAHKQLDKNRRSRRWRRRTDVEQDEGRQVDGQTEGRDGGRTGEASRQQRRTGWQKINHLKPREQSDGGDGRGNVQELQTSRGGGRKYFREEKKKWGQMEKISRLKKKYESGKKKRNQPMSIFNNPRCVSDRVWVVRVCVWSPCSNLTFKHCLH